MMFIRQIFFYLPHARYEKKVRKYALNIMDVASRYEGSYQLTTKNSKEVAQAFQWVYENTLLTYPKTLIIDDRKEFYGDKMKLMGKHYVIIKRGDPSQHRSQGIVERFNRMLADRLFTYQYHKELEYPLKSNREWVSRLQNVVSALNDGKTRLIGMKPIDVIKEGSRTKTLWTKPPIKTHRQNPPRQKTPEKNFLCVSFYKNFHGFSSA